MSRSVTGRFSSGSMTLSSASRICSRLGSISGLSLAIRQQPMDLARKRRDLLRQLLVLLRELGVRLEQLRQPIGLGLDRRDALIAHPDLLLVMPLGSQFLRFVAVGLTRLCEQDQRRCIGSLRREGQIKEDEWVAVEAKRDCDRVERDPRNDDDRLTQDVLRRSEEARDFLGAA